MFRKTDPHFRHIKRDYSLGYDCSPAHCLLRILRRNVDLMAAAPVTKTSTIHCKEIGCSVSATLNKSANACATVSTPLRDLTRECGPMSLDRAPGMDIGGESIILHGSVLNTMAYARSLTEDTCLHISTISTTRAYPITMLIIVMRRKDSLFIQPRHMYSKLETPIFPSYGRV